MIVLNGITKSFERKKALAGVSAELDGGSVYGLVGVNGAGKSTLLRLIAGVLKCDEGTVTIDGRAVDSPDVRKSLFFVADDPFYEFSLTGERLCEFYKTMYDFDTAVFNSYTAKLDYNGKFPIRNYSKGVKRRIFLAAAFACNPKYLLVDEAFDGLDPLCRAQYAGGIARVRESGGTVIIASHSLRELQDVCDGFFILSDTRVKFCGKKTDLPDRLVKLQAAFDFEASECDMPFECVRFNRVGRVVTLFARGKVDELIEALKARGALVVDEISADFEDYFLSELGFDEQPEQPSYYTATQPPEQTQPAQEPPEQTQPDTQSREPATADSIKGKGGEK